MDRRDSITAGELGASAFGISVNNMVARFDELDRLQELAKDAELDREKAINLEAENRELRSQIDTLRQSKVETAVGGRNYKMENLALRALQQQSNKTIAMLQEKLREKTDAAEEASDDDIVLANIVSSAANPIVVNDQWKMSNRKSGSIKPLPGLNVNEQHEIGAGGFIVPGTEHPPSSPLPNHHKQPQHTEDDEETTSGVPESEENALDTNIPPPPMPGASAGSPPPPPPPPPPPSK